jgi:hypothetical protein
MRLAHVVQENLLVLAVCEMKSVLVVQGELLVSVAMQLMLLMRTKSSSSSPFSYKSPSKRGVFLCLPFSQKY